MATLINTQSGRAYIAQYLRAARNQTRAGARLLAGYYFGIAAERAYTSEHHIPATVNQWFWQHPDLAYRIGE